MDHKTFLWKLATVAKCMTGDLRFEYEYEIEYGNDFLFLDCRLYIIKSKTHLIPWASLST